jgi:two-component system OmpR family sensor kinase
MKWWLFVLICLVIILLFGLHAVLFFNLEFTKSNYFSAFIFITPAIFISAYLILLVAYEPKESQDKKLEHLIKESLHELNLPIATIKANIEMLQKGEENLKRLRRIARIEEALRRFRRLYDMLAYNLKKELMPIEREVFDLKALVEERVVFFRYLNRNSFHLNLESMRIYTDKIGLEQVIDNIIENSIKYSPKESAIEITMQGSQLRIKDFGIGIEASELPLIYQRYYQGSEGLKGEGIGLAIVRRYCDSEGVGLIIESQRGVGTEVILDFSTLKK